MTETNEMELQETQQPKSKISDRMKKKMVEVSGQNNQFTYILISFQCILLILFAVCTQYTPPKRVDTSLFGFQTAIDGAYTTFQDVHVMIFIGFGFLMTYLRKYSFSSVSFNLLISAFALQWTIICFGLVTKKKKK